MHRGHDHDHPDGGNSASEMETAGVGHNHAGMRGRPLQWQRRHRDDGSTAEAEEAEHRYEESDLDLVEAAFVEGFAAAGDPTSFLRLAHVPFEAVSGDGIRLSLLRVEMDAVTDVGLLTPHLGGTTFRFDPLPARLISRRKRLRFIYFDGKQLRQLDLRETRTLLPVC
jgi:hypothetical protein